MHKLNIEETSLIAGGASNRDSDLFKAAKEGAVDGADWGALTAFTLVVAFQTQDELRMPVRVMPLFIVGTIAGCAAVSSASRVFEAYFSPVKDEQS